MAATLEGRLAETVELVRGRIRDHRDRLNVDEMVTRVALVDPILRALGWDVADLRHVEVEHNYSRYHGESVDYALWAKPLTTRQSQVKPTGFVEAKKLSDSLAYGDHKDQIDKYRYYTSTVVLTNGDLWKIYRTAPVNFAEGPFSEFRITERDGSAAQKLTELQALLLESDQNAAPEGYGWVPLAAFKPPPKPSKAKWWQAATEPRPGAIKFPGVTLRTIETQQQIVEFTANWLYQTGKLPIGKEIMRPGNKATALLVATSLPSSRNHSQWKPVGKSGSYVYIHGAHTTLLKSAKTLLNACGVDPGSVYLQSQ